VTGACTAVISQSVGRPASASGKPVAASISITKANGKLPATPPRIAKEKKSTERTAHPWARLTGDIGAGTGPR
jgi:hypothetical protein